MRYEEVNGFDIVKFRFKICICIGFLNLFLDNLIDYVILVVFEF